MSTTREIADVVEPTHDELTRQKFVSMLRKHVLYDFAGDMRTAYDERVKPRFVAENGREPKDGVEIRKEMVSDPIFQLWSTLRTNAQLMTWWSVQPSIERKIPELNEVARKAASSNSAPGSLRLDAGVNIPKAVTEIDIHLMPGCFHTEFTEDDVTQGAVYDHGTGVFSAGLPRHRGQGVGASMARYLQAAYPDFAPKKILDEGTTFGRGLFAFLDAYPDLEGYGIDVGAPLLRYGHTKAREMGKAIHFSQQNSDVLDFEDETFDIVTSSFFLHEISVKSTRKSFKEAYRVLKPGGIMLHMELPPASHLDAYGNFATDWDAYWNNEPHYSAFRSLDFPDECARAGFDGDKFVQIRVPNLGLVPDDVFDACARGENKDAIDVNGASWFFFGSWK